MLVVEGALSGEQRALLALQGAEQGQVFGHQLDGGDGPPLHARDQDRQELVHQGVTGLVEGHDASVTRAPGVW